MVLKRCLGVLALCLVATISYAEGSAFESASVRIEQQLIHPAARSLSADCERAVSDWRDDDAMPAERLRAVERVDYCLTYLNAVEMEVLDGPQIQTALLKYQADQKIVQQQEQIEQANTSFLGLSFGVGFGVSYSDDDFISEADIGANNVVRATKENSMEPRVILESHYYGWCRLRKCREGSLGIGPFFGIVARDDKLISAFAAGLMIGWSDSSDDDSGGFSVGVGAILDSDIKTLATGFVDGRPLPEGEEEIRFKTESRWSSIVFLTRTF